MTQPHDEPLSGDLPVTPTTYMDETRPSLSHEVIATYAADAVRSVHGIIDLHFSAWRGFPSRLRETHAGGIVIKDSQPGEVDMEIHARVAWGTSIPQLAHDVEDAVRQRITGLLSLDLGMVTLFVDEIAGPLEGGIQKES